MADEFENDVTDRDQVIGRGHVTRGQVADGIDEKVNTILGEGKRQLEGGCLQEVTTTDQTRFIAKKETIFYMDTDAMRAAGDAMRASHMENQKALMLEDRGNANQAFERALHMVDQETADKAIQVLNHAKETIYYRNFNNYHHQADHSAIGIASQSEMELSWVKSALAAQVADGSFKREMDARTTHGLPVVCEDTSLVR